MQHEKYYGNYSLFFYNNSQFFETFILNKIKVFSSSYKVANLIDETDDSIFLKYLLMTFLAIRFYLKEVVERAI
jgi:hypothetical protein